MDRCNLTLAHHYLVASGVMVIAECIFVTIGAYVISKYIMHHRKENKQTPKLLYSSGLIFLIISLLTILLAITKHSSSVCNDWEWDDTLFLISYYCQMYFLWTVLFIRLYYVFEPTSYKLRPCTVYISCIILALSPFLIILRFAADHVDALALNAEPIMMAIFIFSIIISTAIMVLFIYKLCQMYAAQKENNNDQNPANSKVLSVIIKNSTLAIICLSMNLIDLGCIFYCYFTTDGTDALYIACEFIILVNSLVTFICVVLTYKFMNKIYGKLCGCIDKLYESKEQRRREIVGSLTDATQFTAIEQKDPDDPLESDVNNADDKSEDEPFV